MDQPPQGLSPLAAHNAIANLLALYTGILADYERALQFANAQQARDKANHEQQLTEGKALNEKLRADNKLLADTVTTLRAEVEKVGVLAGHHVLDLFDTYTAGMVDAKQRQTVCDVTSAVRETFAGGS